MTPIVWEKINISEVIVLETFVVMEVLLVLTPITKLVLCKLAGRRGRRRNKPSCLQATLRYHRCLQAWRDHLSLLDSIVNSILTLKHKNRYYIYRIVTETVSHILNEQELGSIGNAYGNTLCLLLERLAFVYFQPRCMTTWGCTHSASDIYTRVIVANLLQGDECLHKASVGKINCRELVNMSREADLCRCSGSLDITLWVLDPLIGTTNHCANTARFWVL